jgi:hypothetical protein
MLKVLGIIIEKLILAKIFLIKKVERKSKNKYIKIN